MDSRNKFNETNNYDVLCAEYWMYIFCLFFFSKHSRVQHAITKLEFNRRILPANKNINFTTQKKRRKKKCNSILRTINCLVLTLPVEDVKMSTVERLENENLWIFRCGKRVIIFNLVRIHFLDIFSTDFHHNRAWIVLCLEIWYQNMTDRDIKTVLTHTYTHKYQFNFNL